VMDCPVCGGIIFSKGKCKSCYMKEYQKKYKQSDAFKEYQKKYKQSDAYKESQKNRKVSLKVFVSDFFKHFGRIVRRNPSELNSLAESFSKNACELSGREQCMLEEMILIESGKQ